MIASLVRWLRQRRPWQWQLLAHLLALLPLLSMALALAGYADPVADLERASGVATLQLLLASLLVRPLAQQLRFGSLMVMRRPLGLWAFAYGCGHFSVWLVIDQQLDWLVVGHELSARLHLQLGLLALCLLLPLAVTSTRALQRRMGRWWQRLHRLVYLIAVVAIIHYLLAIKSLHLEPVVYAGLTALLLLWRLPFKGWWERFHAVPRSSALRGPSPRNNLRRL